MEKMNILKLAMEEKNLTLLENKNVQKVENKEQQKMKYIYKPTGVCSSEMIFEIDENNVIQNLKIIGGCNGNLKGISSLVKGMKVDDVIEKLSNISCGVKETSCPDQIAKALAQYKLEKEKL